jgi:general secretion pathway protein D
MSHAKRWRRLAAVGLLLALSIGCAAQKAYSRAEREMRRENYDKAVLEYSKALAMEPGNTRYAIGFERAKLRGSTRHFMKAQRYHQANQFELAIAEYQQTLLLNPGNEYAQNEMRKAMRALQLKQSGPSRIEEMKRLAALRDLAPPKLHPGANIPILMRFEEAEIGKIFEAIGKASGINFVFDDKVDAQKPLTIDIGNVSMEKALDVLMLQTKNFYKVIDEHTLLIAPDTRQKRQEYDDQVIRTFFLSNADTKTVVTVLRSLLQSRQIAENADLNSVTIKDTPAKIAIAERIIRANDKSKGEVIIDVELIEINRTLTKQLGIDLSSKTLGLTFLGGDASVPLNNLDILRQTGNWTVGVIPSVILDFLKSDSDSKLIAKPQLRVAEGEEASILIGDRVPIPTTTFNTSNTIGSSVVPITSFTYQNVGITVRVKPRVHHNKEVTLQVEVEISRLSGTVETSAGQRQPIIGTRTITTVIRLRDGETNLLAGLIQHESRNLHSGVAGLMDVPGLGRVFSSNSLESSETEIVMTLTPHIVRIPDITEEDLATLWVGTEEHMQLRGSAQNALGQSPFAAVVDFSAAAAPTNNDAGSSSGNVNTTTSSDEVENDTARAVEEQEREAREAAAPDDGQRDSGNAPGNVPGRSGPRGAQDNTDDGSADEPDDTPEDDTPPTGPAVISLIPSSLTYHVGDTVVIEVVMSNANNVGSTPFHLRYNPRALQFISPATEGPLMRSDGANTVFLATPAGGEGELVVGLSRMGAGQGVSGTGTLAVFQFLAIAPGDGGFNFTGAAIKDPQARNLPAAFNTATIKVEP